MKQPLFPLFQNQPSTISEPLPLPEVMMDTDPSVLVKKILPGGIACEIREVTVNGFTFSYQSWMIDQEAAIPFSSRTGAGILYFGLAGKPFIHLPGKEEGLPLSEAVCSLGVHRVNEVHLISFPSGNHQYLQMALSLPLLNQLLQLLPGIQLPSSPFVSASWFYLPPVPVSKKIKKLLPAIRSALLQQHPDVLTLNQLGIQMLKVFHTDLQRLGKRQTWELRKGLKLDDLEAYIDDHLDAEDRSRLRIDALAKQLRLQRRQFVVLFRQRYGQPPAAFIRLRRLSIALLLLEQGQAPGEIYPAVGFEDFASFTKSFSRYYGKPPSYFRKRQG